MSTALALRDCPSRSAGPLPDTALERMAWSSIADGRIRCAGPRPRLTLDRGGLVVSGEVPDLCSKRILLPRLTDMPGVERVVDRLRVAPPVAMTDDRILAWVLGTLAEEPSFDGCVLGVADELGRPIAPRRVRADREDHLRVAVEDGIVTLEGTVPTRNHARLACAIAWWVPGARDVHERLHARLPEPLTGETALLDGIRVILERDPLLAGAEVALEVIRATVLLSGSVRSAVERCAVESDVWTIAEVAEVINEIELTSSSMDEIEADFEPERATERVSGVELTIAMTVPTEHARVAMPNRRFEETQPMLIALDA